MKLKFPKIKRIHFSIKFSTKAILSEWKGHTIRGAAAEAVKHTFCERGLKGNCKKCREIFICPYGYIFESRPSKHAKSLSKIEQITKPYVIKPPLDNETLYSPKKELNFEMVLFGKGTRYVEAITAALSQNLKQIGKFRKKYGKIEEVNFSISDEKLSPYSSKNYSINFLTPVHLMRESAMSTAISGNELLSAISRKYSSMVEFHEFKREDINWKEMFKLFKSKIITNESIFKNVEVSRWSSKLKRKYLIPAIKGSLKIEVLDELVKFVGALLKFGEFCHIGKFATSGFGWYETIFHC